MVLRHVEVPIVANRDCNLNYGMLRTQFGPQYAVDIEETMLCAGVDEGGKDACQVIVNLFKTTYFKLYLYYVPIMFLFL